MQAIKNYGDYAVRATEQSADDEYQRDMLHKANTVAAESSATFIAIVFAILAWILPGTKSVFAGLIVLPLAFSQAVGMAWLMKYAPRPRPRPLFTRANIPFLIFWAAGLVGIGYNNFNNLGGAVGMITGTTLALVAVIVLGPRETMRRRRKDARRLESELED